jgi:nucleoside-diphosphate-sugar epimerase
VVHLAAAHHDFGIEEKTYYDVNEGGTKVLVDAMDAAGVRELCFYSTVAVYGDAPEPHTEETPPAPTSPYGGSKLAGEKVLEAWTNQGEGRRATIIRPTVTFGPRNFANMYTLIHQIQSGRFLLVGKGENIKSLSYVENIVAATLFLMAANDRPAFDVVNYIDKPDLSSMQITETVYGCLGKSLPKLRIPMGVALFLALPFDIVIKLTGKNLKVSSARVKKLFAAQTKYETDRLEAASFTAPVPLKDGIARMVRWYLDKGRHEQAEWRQPPAEPVLRSS